MFRQPFIPSRSSRHRVAALALYRALIRTGQKVPLPKQVRHKGARHPIAHIIKKRFIKNKIFTSLRLVHNAMSAGYKFLTLLTKAQIKDSPEHSKIVQHLQKRKETAEISRSKAPPRSEPRYNPPLLTKVSKPDEPPRYEPTVRPLPKSAFVGQRKVPAFSSTAEGYAFLRIKKPQPMVLSRAIGRKSMLYRRQIEGLKEAETDYTPVAKEEDRWDAMMNAQLEQEGFPDRVLKDDKFASHRWTAHLTRTWYASRLDDRWKDWIARGKAVQQLAEEERALAREEEGSGSPPTDPAVARTTLDSILEKARKDLAERKENEPRMEFKDPFMSPAWVRKVRNMESDRPLDFSGDHKRPQQGSAKRERITPNSRYVNYQKKESRVGERLPTGFEALQHGRRQ
ncbi:hypothetical protein F66182_3832 [Fusarium sp. NRRL 66182]|nr:hypothetical protein F66182_3832 [Fusarium sp. NRRL 66182]